MLGTGHVWIRMPLTGTGSFRDHPRDIVGDPLFGDTGFTVNLIPRTRLPRVLPRPFLAFFLKSPEEIPMNIGIVQPEQDI